MSDAFSKLPMFWQQICCRIKLIEPHSRSHKPCTYKALRTSVDEQTNLKWQQRSCNSIGRFRDFVSAIERFRAKARKSGTERFAPCHSLQKGRLTSCLVGVDPSEKGQDREAAQAQDKIWIRVQSSIRPPYPFLLFRNRLFLELEPSTSKGSWL